MKQYTEIIKDSFVDFAGNPHYFTIVAISIPTDGEVTIYNDNPYYDGCPYNITKGLKIGISICNPDDEYDEELGEQKAIKKALKSDFAIVTSNSGLVSTPMVQAILHKEAEYLKNNPEKYIKGYKTAKLRWEEDKKMEELNNSFSDSEKKIVDAVKNGHLDINSIMNYVDYLNKKDKRSNIEK